MRRTVQRRAPLLAALATPLVALAALLCAAGAHAAPARAPAHTPARAAAGAAIRLAISYTGGGGWWGRLHSTPPNPGGAPDTNDGHDSSTEDWSLAWPAASLRSTSLAAAAGRERVHASIYHHHRDGLYAQDDYTESCRYGASADAGNDAPLGLSVRRGRLVLTLPDPVIAALEALPVQCPGNGDPGDGFPDNIFTPGFSFDSGWGPDRWFTPAPVSISIARLRRLPRGGSLRLRLGPAAANTPPAGCAKREPADIDCHTGGRWSATLTLTRAR